jgi:hypothetical protein
MDPDTPSTKASLQHMNAQLAGNGEAYDPKTGYGSVYLLQNDGNPVVGKGIVTGVDGNPVVHGTTSDMLLVTWADGKLKNVESVDDTTTTNTSADAESLKGMANTIRNKFINGRKKQTQNVVFSANTREQAEALAQEFDGNKNVRILHLGSGFDSGEFGAVASRAGGTRSMPVPHVGGRGIGGKLMGGAGALGEALFLWDAFRALRGDDVCPWPLQCPTPEVI